MEHKHTIPAFKVVGPEGYGSNVTGLLWLTTRYRGESDLLKVRQFIKAHEKLCPIYKEGEVVKALPHSVGVLCFRHYHDAARFKEGYRELANARILKIKGHKPSDCCTILGGAMDLSYLSKLAVPDRLPEDGLVSAPLGTIGFESIRVGKETTQ